MQGRARNLQFHFITVSKNHPLAHSHLAASLNGFQIHFNVYPETNADLFWSPAVLQIHSLQLGKQRRIPSILAELKDPSAFKCCRQMILKGRINPDAGSLHSVQSCSFSCCIDILFPFSFVQRKVHSPSLFLKGLQYASWTFELPAQGTVCEHIVNK